jgi:hypothetical protein
VSSFGSCHFTSSILGPIPAATKRGTIRALSHMPACFCYLEIIIVSLWRSQYVLNEVETFHSVVMNRILMTGFSSDKHQCDFLIASQLINTFVSNIQIFFLLTPQAVTTD